MDAAYSAAEWTDLFVATAGAAAALAGLLFVAISINGDRILKQPAGRGRWRALLGPRGLLIEILR